MDLVLYFIFFTLFIIVLNGIMILKQIQRRERIDWHQLVISILLLLLMYVVFFY
ncbi:hypothetical protein [Telluribacter humicola]|uniref:hypothetical protein n=1 Tax=Telluribacter humicola TaxID=1720261 RepID=UPI001A975692|nr:hypothetical protein [Telluribacter humicola]